MTETEHPDPLLRWWRSLTPEQRAAFRALDGTAIGTATHLPIDNAAGDWIGMQRIDSGGGTWSLPAHLRDDEETAHE